MQHIFELERVYIHQCRLTTSCKSLAIEAYTHIYLYVFRRLFVAWDSCRRLDVRPHSVDGSEIPNNHLGWS